MEFNKVEGKPQGPLRIDNKKFKIMSPVLEILVIKPDLQIRVTGKMNKASFKKSKFVKHRLLAYKPMHIINDNEYTLGVQSRGVVSPERALLMNMEAYVGEFAVIKDHFVKNLVTIQIDTFSKTEAKTTKQLTIYRYTINIYSFCELFVAPIAQELRVLIKDANIRTTEASSINVQLEYARLIIDTFNKFSKDEFKNVCLDAIDAVMNNYTEFFKKIKKHIE